MSREFARLIFEGGWTSLDEEETPRRGYRGDAWAVLEDGSRVRLTFYDLNRLSQTLDDEVRGGRPFLLEPGLIVLAEVTLESMDRAAREMVKTGLLPGF